MYGQGVFVDGALIETVKVSEDFCLNVRGAEKPISVDYIRRGR